jgi:hypothetical protein
MGRGVYIFEELESVVCGRGKLENVSRSYSFRIGSD